MASWLRLIAKLLVFVLLFFVAEVFAVRTIGVSGIYGTESSKADFIRSKCPIHLVSPDWVSSDGDLINWIFAETSARMNMVIVIWLIGTIAIVAWHFRVAQLKA